MRVVSCVLFETYSKQVLPSLQECHWKAYCAFKRCMYSTVLKGVVHTSSEKCACVCLTMKLCFGAILAIQLLQIKSAASWETSTSGKGCGNKQSWLHFWTLGSIQRSAASSQGAVVAEIAAKKNSNFQLDRFLWFHYVLLQSIRITMLHDIFAGWWMAESPKIHGKTGRCQRCIRLGPGWCFRPRRRLCEFEMWIIPCWSHIHSSIMMPYGINHVKYVFFCGIQNKWNIME